MTSFKELLKEKVQREGYTEYSSLVSFANQEGYKVSTMDREMRRLCNEFPIEAIEKKSKRGSSYISGYFWKEASAFQTHSGVIDGLKPFVLTDDNLKETAQKVLSVMPTHVLTNLGNGTERIKINDLVSRINAMSPFSEKKEQKEIKESKDPNRTNRLF